jgi:hypothetical protein
MDPPTLPSTKMFYGKVVLTLLPDDTHCTSQTQYQNVTILSNLTFLNLYTRLIFRGNNNLNNINEMLLIIIKCNGNREVAEKTHVFLLSLICANPPARWPCTLAMKMIITSNSFFFSSQSCQKSESMKPDHSHCVGFSRLLTVRGRFTQNIKNKKFSK